MGITHNNENSINLTAKDRKIFRELFDDGRKPFSVIAKRIGMSKEAVNYRVKRLLDEGILEGFNTIIDIKKLGWEMFLVYIRFKNIDIEKEEQILERLKNHKNISWIIKCIGNYDFIIRVFVRDYAEVDRIMKDIGDEFKHNIDEYEINYLDEEYPIPFSFFYQGEKVDTKAYIGSMTKGNTVLDDVDLKLLSGISINARVPISELSKELDISRDVLKYRLRKLEKNKVILKYRPGTAGGMQKLGFNWYFVILKLGKMDAKTKSSLTDYLLKHPNSRYFYKTVGSSDIQIELEVMDTSKLNDILMELRGILKNTLKRHELLLILKEHKYTYFPECMMGGKRIMLK